VGDVTECGLKGYENRHAAKQAAKHHHHNHVRAFKCKRGCGYWHLGELPVEVMRGDLTAGEFYTGRDQPVIPSKEKQRSPAAQLRRWRLNTAAGIARDSKALAELLADQEVFARDSPGWKQARDDAAEILAALPRLMRQLAEHRAPDGQP
jgi:hypothetical protein